MKPTSDNPGVGIYQNSLLLIASRGLTVPYSIVQYMIVAEKIGLRLLDHDLIPN